jgi:hypothetical protein
MKRLLFLLMLAGLLAPAALAKGPSQATVTGPGLGKTISFTGSGEASGSALGNLTEYAGFFPAAFGQSPDPMLGGGRPAGRLGPKFTIHYVVPGGNGAVYRLTQDLYPYARGGALTYLKPGQAIFDSPSRGGWYRGGDVLKQTLVRAGLPATAPRGGGGTDWTPIPTWLAAVAGALLLLAVSAFGLRRARVAAPA